MAARTNLRDNLNTVTEEGVLRAALLFGPKEAMRFRFPAGSDALLD